MLYNKVIYVVVIKTFGSISPECMKKIQQVHINTLIHHIIDTETGFRFFAF